MGPAAGLGCELPAGRGGQESSRGVWRRGVERQGKAVMKKALSLHQMIEVIICRIEGRAGVENALPSLPLPCSVASALRTVLRLLF